MPRFAGYLPGTGAVDLDRLVASVEPGKAVMPILFYRALLLADDTAASTRFATHFLRAGSPLPH